MGHSNYRTAASMSVAIALTFAASAGLADPSRARATLDDLRSTNPDLTVSWPVARTTPWRVSGLSLPSSGATAPEQAGRFLADHGGLLDLAEAPRLLDHETRARRTTVRFAPMHAGRPVVDRSIVVRIEDGRIRSVINEAVPLTHVEPAVIDGEAARALVREAYGLEPAPGVREIVMATGDQGVEGFEVSLVVNPLQSHLVVRVDGHHGTIVGARNQVVR